MVSFNWSQPELVDRIAKLERKVAALQRDEERTTIALAQSSVGVFDWHLSRRSIYLSPILQDLLGYEGENMPGHLDAWIEHLHIGDRLRAQQEVNDALGSREKLFRGAYRIVRRDGASRRFLFQATILRSGDSEQPKASRVLGTAIDISDFSGTLGGLGEL